jgi:hypothetical protein
MVKYVILDFLYLLCGWTLMLLCLWFVGTMFGVTDGVLPFHLAPSLADATP